MDLPKPITEWNGSIWYGGFATILKEGGTAVKRQYCAHCDDDMGEWTKFSDRHDTCGKPECERFGRDQDRAERDEAHERLDRDIGYDRW